MIKKLTKLQETLRCVTTAVANIANLVLKANNQSRMADTKSVVTQALNATTLMGNIHSKLNNKKEELIGKTLPADIREVFSSQREATTQIFGDDLRKAVREAKEMNNCLMTSLQNIGKEDQLSVKHQPPNTINGAQMVNTLLTMVQVANILVGITLIKPQIESRVFVSAGAPTGR